jgi:hypothetical protein
MDFFAYFRYLDEKVAKTTTLFLWFSENSKLRILHQIRFTPYGNTGGL